jgi:hypothetical protein
MFKSVIKKFDKYLDMLEVENPNGFNEDLWTEVRKRLQQLEWLFESISGKHTKCLELSWRENRRIDRLRKEHHVTSGSITLLKTRDSRKIDRLLFEMETLTEGFYYLAHRMRVILRHASKPLPGLHTFECVGARNARNKLLGHVEKDDSKIFGQSFGVGGDQGPTLKVERQSGEENRFPDAGLPANATEIRDNLERLLDAVLSKPKSTPSRRKSSS